MARIEELEIRNFRGAAGSLKLDFPKDSRLTVIFGENGTGKTTIVDAIDLVGNQNVGSIKEKSSTNIEKHSPTLGKRTSDIHVTAKWGQLEWKGGIKSGKIQVEPLPGPRVRILRRSNVQRFIEAQPAGRYVEIKHLIGVDRVERSEKALNDAMNAASGRADEFARDYANAEELIERLWQEAGSPGDDALAWARERPAKFGQEFAEREAAFQKLLAALNTLVHARQMYERVLQQQAEAESTLSAVRSQIDDLGGLDVGQTIEVSRLLKSARQVLTVPDSSDICPVCEQVIVPSDVLERVSNRLLDLQALLDLDEQQNAWQSRCDAENRSMERWTVNVTNAARAVVALQAEDSPAAAYLHAIAGISVEGVDPALAVATAVEKLPATIDVERNAAAEMKGSLLTLETALQTIDTAKQDAAEADKTRRALKRALGIVRAQRHQFTQALLDAVADDTNEFYRKIHPDEGLAISKLALDPKYRASLNQSATFGGRDDVPPQAYYSEAHLDTLGFCFWLADARRQAVQGGERPILVIDDVFGSSDTQHMTRIVDLIADEARNFAQVILTTHHRSLRDRFKRTNKAMIFDLDSRWSLSRGIRVKGNMSIIDELRKAMDDEEFDRQLVAAKAGVLLEQLLDDLALRYQTKLARKDPPLYTLNELMSGTRKLVQEIKIRSLDGDVSQRQQPVAPFQEIEKIEFIRNEVGAHFNPAADEVSDRDVESFARNTLALCDALYCKTCQQMPSINTGMDYRCRCKQSPLVMTPLQFRSK